MRTTLRGQSGYAKDAQQEEENQTLEMRGCQILVVALIPLFLPQEEVSGILLPLSNTLLKEGVGIEGK